MENASKALIIAGAILLSILIIALGMGVFNQAKEAMSGSSLTAEQAATYNEKYEKYSVGTQTGTKIRSLCNEVKNHNLAQDVSDTYAITLTYGNSYKAISSASDINNLINDIKIGNKYDVELTYDTSIGGLINAITITDHK